MKRIIIISLCGLAGLATLLWAQNDQKKQAMTTSTQAPEQPKEIVEKSADEWKKELTPEQYRVLRESGTERPHGEVYDAFKKQGGGTYYCAGCGAELFSSDHKFDAHCGWPAFYDASNNKNLLLVRDVSHGMLRTEVQCAKCKGHLGHLFSGEGFNTPKDQRYCINGVTLKFVPHGEKKPETVPNTSSSEKEKTHEPSKP
jgi:peptide-methionine (R)-S-oxide reductase